MQRYSEMKTKEFIYGNHCFDYELIRQNRKTLSLTVRPDLGIVVKCPDYAEDNRIDQFLKRKWFWMVKQLRYFEKYQRKIYRREYISGESFMYLGRQYQLIVRKGDDGISLIKGKLMIDTSKSVSNGQYNKKLINDWYLNRAEIVFKQRFEEVLQGFNYDQPPELELRKMNKRWGSFLGNKKIYLNPLLISTSKECVDYVITHELCHVKHRNHDKKFYAFLKSKMPDWERRKEKLEGCLY